MHAPDSGHRQQGATLIVSLIMLVMITLIVTSAISLSMGNLRAVGNMQFRSEAIAAGNTAIERFVSSNFAASLGSTTFPVAYNIDTNSDGTAEYQVNIQQPTCSRASPISNSSAVSRSLDACVTTGYWSLCSDTNWDVHATVTDASLFAGFTGVSVDIHRGIATPLNSAIAASVCI